METPVALQFAEAVRQLTDVGRHLGLDVPAFRSPPRTPGALRALRRHPAGTVVAVQLRGRPFDAVLADMVDGVLAANACHGAAAGRLRAELLAALGAPLGPVPSLPSARVAERQTQAA
ncbi:MAG: hypothetical protein ACOYNI_03320 [Acidimicrobiia bacterium]